MMLRLQFLTVVVAASYVTLGFANPDRAQSLWAVYGGIMLALAVANLFIDRQRKER